MLAKYSGWCPFCNDHIEAGVDLIGKKGARWGHLKCTDPEAHAAMQAEEATPRTMTPEVLKRTRQALWGADAGDIATAIATSAPAEDTPQKIVSDKPFKPSPYQQAVFDFISKGKGNAVVEAVAGSGKTTTIVKALDLTPTDAKVAFVAFNKHIADELKKRAPVHVHVSTLHSLGLSCLRSVLGYVDVDEDKVDHIMNKYLPIGRELDQDVRIHNRTVRGILRRMVSLAKAVLAEDEPGAKSPHAAMRRGFWADLADMYGIELNDEEEEVIRLLPQVLEDCREQLKIVDYDDMIYLPVYLDMPMEKFDWLFVDEAQDLNASQIVMILSSIAKGGRIIAVGDRKQSLYGFRGADVEAIPRLIKALKAKTLPLSITYRCPASHVRRAKELVPQLEARDGAPEGTLEEIVEADVVRMGGFKDGDMVLCRTNAPLVPVAFELIRGGTKATIRGRDIGRNLAEFVRKFKANSMDELYSRMSEWQQKEVHRLLDAGKELQATLVQDKVETVVAIGSESEDPEDLVLRILDIFQDQVTGVVLSSVHRAKGLEGSRIFLLHPELLPHPKAKKAWELQQEMNCLYVALTRSKDQLYLVHPK